MMRHHQLLCFAVLVLVTASGEERAEGQEDVAVRVRGEIEELVKEVRGRYSFQGAFLPPLRFEMAFTINERSPVQVNITTAARVSNQEAAAKNCEELLMLASLFDLPYAGCVNSVIHQLERHRRFPFTQIPLDGLPVNLLQFYLQAYELEAAILDSGLAIREGHTGFCPQKILALLDLVSRTPAKFLCEVGFNAGHSALATMIAADSDALLITFDLGAHGYGHFGRRFIQERFQQRLRTVLGDSHSTLFNFLASYPDFVGCDILMIDGDHTREGAMADLLAGRMLVNPERHLLIFDDVLANFPGSFWAWNTATAKNIVVEEGQVLGQNFDDGLPEGQLSWGHYVI